MPKNRDRNFKTILLTHEDFYKHPNWKKCKEIINNANKMQCLKCGATDKICVDHIKPKTKKPRLCFDVFNLQQLCEDCNKQKYLDDTDYRDESYIQNIKKYLEENNINYKSIKFSSIVSGIVFTYPKNYKKPKSKKIVKKTRKKNHNKIRDRLNNSLYAGGFRDKDYDINKLLDLQNK